MWVLLLLGKRETLASGSVLGLWRFFWVLLRGKRDKLADELCGDFFGAASFFEALLCGLILD